MADTHNIDKTMLVTFSVCHSICIPFLAVSVGKIRNYHRSLTLYYHVSTHLSLLLCMSIIYSLQTSRLVDDILGELQSLRKQVNSFEDLKEKVIGAPSC